jgi:hypothetical protein
MFRLTPPKHETFYISVALAIVAVILQLLAFLGLWAPVPTAGFLILLIGYLVLFAGVLLEGA